MFRAIGRAIGRRVAEEVVTEALIANALAAEWERMAQSPEWRQHAKMLQEMANRARAQASPLPPAASPLP